MIPPPFNIVRAFKTTELLTAVRLEQSYVDGSTKRRYINPTDGSSVELNLYVYNNFIEAAAYLDFDAEDKFDNFAIVLTDAVRDDWQTILDNGDFDNTEADWTIASRQWIRTFLRSSARQQMVDYFADIVKPRKWTVSAFIQRLKTIRRMITIMPPDAGDLTPTITETQLKNSIFRAMPRDWQTSFIRVHQSAGNVTLLTLEEFMSNEKDLEDNHVGNQRNVSGSRRSNESQPSDRSENRRHSRHNRRNNTRQNQNNNQDNRQQRGKRNCPRNPCRKQGHAGHDWSECYDNPNGNNYRPNRNRPRDQQSSNQNDRSSQQRSSDQYYQQPVVDGRTQYPPAGPPSQVYHYQQVPPQLLPPPPAGSYTQGASKQFAMPSLAQSYTNTPIPHIQTPPVGHVSSEEKSSTPPIHVSPQSHPLQSCISQNEARDLAPITILHARLIQNSNYEVPLRTLIDTGSTTSHIHARCLPKGINPTTIPTQHGQTIGGFSTTNQQITLKDVTFPEFTKHQILSEQKFQVFNAPCYYDIILGRDCMRKINSKVDLDDGTMTIFNHTRPLREQWEIDNRNQFFYDQFEEASDSFYDAPTSGKIMESKYEEVDIDAVVNAQSHLDKDEQSSLRRVLSKHKKLFSGKLGRYPHKKMDLELIPGAQPIHLKAYSIARINEIVFREEIKRLCSIGVLSRVGATEWAFPSFAVPKKDGRIRFISDFRQLNALIKRKIYPLPKIQDILRKRKGYTRFTKIDVSMQYYTFELTERAKNLCVIVTPFGKFRYNVAPMGVKLSPDFAQEVMEDMFKDLEDLEVYIDDIGLWLKDTAHSEELEDKVLTILEDNGFTVNPLKCEWRVKETDWLGHWLTPHGIKPWHKKINALLKMEKPTNLTQLRAFIGSANFYRDLFPRRSHLLAPLTELTGKKMIEWTDRQQKAFLALKALMVRDCLCHYPNHNLPFDIYTDASDYQLGSVIMQQGRPVAYYSRKLNKAQMSYTTLEKELLSIYETFREFESMLLGAEITVHTDHRNLTTGPSTNQRVLRHLSFCEQFHPKYVHIPGEDNFIADMISRLPIRDDIIIPEEKKGELIAHKLTFDSYYSSSLYDCLHDPRIQDAFLNLPEVEQFPLPLDYPTIAQQQQQDQSLQQRRWSNPMRYPNRQLGGTELVTHTDDNGKWRICLPTQTLEQTVSWYHESLAHCGATKLYQTIHQHFEHPKLKAVIDNMCRSCDACQRNTVLGKQYGHLPKRIDNELPWQTVATDLIGPWQVKFQNETYEFYALTCIDLATGYPDAIRIYNKTASHVGMQFENLWCSRYPRPVRCLHDKGTEFMGQEFQNSLNRFGIQSKSITVRNPQANSICERLHQTVAKTLRILIHHRPPQNIYHVGELVDSAIATSLHSVRATVHSTMGLSPGAIAFHRDMMHNIPLQVDFPALREKRQIKINENLIRSNNKRIHHNYQPNDEVLVIAHEHNKLDPKAIGPHRILRAFTNGTVEIDKGNNVRQLLNIRWIRPYYRHAPIL